MAKSLPQLLYLMLKVMITRKVLLTLALAAMLFNIYYLHVSTTARDFSQPRPKLEYLR